MEGPKGYNDAKANDLVDQKGMTTTTVELKRNSENVWFQISLFPYLNKSLGDTEGKYRVTIIKFKDTDKNNLLSKVSEPVNLIYS